MFGNINTIIPKTMPTVSGCACKMIVKRMEKTGGKRRGKRLFNSPALQAQIASISQLMGSCHSPSELLPKTRNSEDKENVLQWEDLFHFCLSPSHSAPDTLW